VAALCANWGATQAEAFLHALLENHVRILDARHD
jgi:hypothetical protein